MRNKLFVGGLAWAATDQDLQGLFADFGEVLSAKVVMDKFTGKSRGFGFVEMGSDDQAASAAAALNETEFMGRKIAVTEARPRE